MKQTFAIGIGGAAGQGVATPGDIFAKIFSRRGLHLNAYNAYQSIIRGGHTLLTIRTGTEKVTNMGDRIDLLIPLNQDTCSCSLPAQPVFITPTRLSQALLPTGCSFVRFRFPSWPT
jgi:Tfp pilus assembly protein PilZ